jgi:acetyl esterase/lipase
MQPSDVLSRPSRSPDLVLAYGEGEDRVADVRLPVTRADVMGSLQRDERAPLVLFLHGGFWRAAYDRAHTGPLADALADSGFVVCAPEYRKVGQAGGGWPGTFEDVAAAVEALPRLVARATDDLTDGSRFILGGHSAGGHLALWAAAQQTPVARTAVVSLAGVCDLAAAYRQDLGRGAAGELMGGGPDLFPGRYASADPTSLTPIGVPITLVHGTADDRVPWQQSRDFAAKAQVSGDEMTCNWIDGCGHFEVIDPLSVAWPIVLAAFRATAAVLART